MTLTTVAMRAYPINGIRRARERAIPCPIDESPRWVVCAIDYQGLGTPGMHLYPVNVTNAQPGCGRHRGDKP